MLEYPTFDLGPARAVVGIVVLPDFTDALGIAIHGAGSFAAANLALGVERWLPRPVFGVVHQTVKEFFGVRFHLATLCAGF